MSIVILAIVLLSFLAIIPYVITLVLKFILWKFSFTARVNGFFSFKEIMLRVPLHLNFSVLIRIESASLSFKFISKVAKISLVGLQVNILVKDELENWATRKIELLQMLEDIRNSLKRKGELKPSILSLNRQNQSSINEQSTLLNINNTESVQTPLRSALRNSGSGVNHNQPVAKPLIERILDKLLNSLEFDASDTAISFYVYKDEEKVIEEANVKRFHTQYLLDREFRERNLAFRIYVEQARLNVKSMNEEEIELLIQSECVRVQNPSQLHKQGTLNNVQVIIKVPLDKKLAKDLCNFEIRVNVQSGLLNINNKFLRKAIRFFVSMDTLKAVLKRVKKLILKLHYQEEMLQEMEERRQQLENNNGEGGPKYENVRDIDIPKRLQVVVQEGITIILTDSDQKLKPFLQSTIPPGASSQWQQQGFQYAEINCVRLSQVTFELLRTLKNSYYMTVSSEKIHLECNQQQALVINNFFEELDFSDKKQITAAPIKEVKTDIINTIKADSMEINVTKPLTKMILDIIGIYKEMVHIASVKHRIMNIILDKDFLKTNLLLLSSSQNEETEKEKQIFELFREKKKDDFLVNEIVISKITGEIKPTVDGQVDSQGDGIDIKISDFRNKLKAEKGVDELVTKIGRANISPKKSNTLAILKLENFQNNILTMLGSTINQDYITTSFDKGQVNSSIEIFMDMGRDMLDFKFIFRYFSKKWARKHFVKQNKKKTILESLVFKFKEAQLIAPISKSRQLAFRFVDFKTNSTKRAFSKNDITSISYSCKKISMFHTRTIKEQTVPGRIYCDTTEERKIENIIDSDDVDLNMTINPSIVKVQVIVNSLDFTLPPDLQFCALIYELIKQASVSTKWFKQEYVLLKRKANFQFSKELSISRKSSKQLQLNKQQTSSQAAGGTKKAFLLEVEVNTGVIKAEETALKEVFVNKNEIVETLQEREIYRCKPSIIMKLLKRLKQSSLNGNQTIIQTKRFKMMYEISQFFLDFQNVFTVIQKLDEAKKTMTPSLFKEFDPAIHTYTAEYISYHIRNLQKPLIEAWNVDMKFLIVSGTLNPKQNPSLFKTQVREQIFNKFEITQSFNKLMSKIYYNCELKCDKIKLNIQGQQSILCLSDFGEVYTKFGFDDMSKSKDPKKQKLNYYSGLDSMRNRFHGKLKVELAKLEVQIYPKRKFNRYDSYLQVNIDDLRYTQNFMNQEISMRNIIASKSPLKSYESASLKIPLLELQFYMVYNQGRTLNHFTHNGAKNIGQYLDQLKAYSSQEVELDCKLNIASLGYINPADQQCVVVKDLMNQYIQKSPVVVVHYQRSHMKFFDQLYKEYILKKDYSGAVLRRQAEAGGPKVKSRKSHMFGVKIKALINDVMIIFTDFKDREGDFMDDSPIKQLDGVLQKKQRNLYLTKYQGIMFTQENLCMQSQIIVRKVKDETSIELKNSSLSGNFLRLSCVNDSNLFQIRHNCFKQLREKQFESSMDNYKQFCQFFELNPAAVEKTDLLQFNSVLCNFKTLFPLLLAKNIQLQNEIIFSTLNNNAKNPFSSDDFRTLIEDFVFSNTDTIGVLLSMSYKQDQEIMFSHMSSEKIEARQYNRNLNPLIIEQPAGADENEEEKLLVKHMIDIKGFRFLYTKITKEHIIHHLVKGFNYNQFRKTDFIDVEAQKDSRDFLHQYEYTYAGRSRKGPNFNDTDSVNHNNDGTSKSRQSNNAAPNTQMINLRSLKRTALVAIRLDDPQVNFQNELTKSQMLLNSAQPTLAVIFGYSKVTPIIGGGSGLGLNYDDLNRCKSGYQINSNEEIVRYELSLQVKEMDTYVAPTSINLENPTFFMEHQQQAKSPEGSSEQNSYRSIISTEREPKTENIMQKIITVNNISFTFDFLKEEFVDYLNSEISVDIFVEKLNSEMNGPNMWHFVYVLMSILFDRGEKAEEVIIIEQKRTEEMLTMKLDIIKNIIDQKLKKTFQNHGGGDNKPDISKKVNYTILNGQFTLIDFDKMFAQVVLSKVKGTHLIYSNREARADIDVDKILIENHADSEEYRMVLFPGYSLSSFGGDHHHGGSIGGHLVNQDTMIKIRARDKFVVVKQAPWRVFDQFEVFIFPTSLQFTNNFYKHLRNFFFLEGHSKKMNLNKMEEEQKYELLVPTKILHKAQKQKKIDSKNSLDMYQKDPLKSAKGPGAGSGVGGVGGRDHLATTNTDQETDRNNNALVNKLKLKLPAETHRQELEPISDDEYNSSHLVPAKEKNKNDESQIMKDFPIFFRYMRMNEINMSITYFHNKNSFLNSKNIKIKLAPFIRHGKFLTFQKIFEKYEGHCKKNFISQIPSLIKQKLLQTKEKLNTKGVEGVDDDIDDQIEIKKELKLHNAKKIVFGEFYH